MIEKFFDELKSELDKCSVEGADLVASYEALYNKYINLGQSEFDIIRHFGEPSEIVKKYKEDGIVPEVNMERELDFDMPAYLAKEEEEHNEVKEEKLPNIAPVTKGGMVANDILFVGLGLLIALAGCIAVMGVAVFMTASSFVQFGAVWELPKGQQVPGFMLALMFFVMSIIMYVVVVWIVKVVVKFMKRYVRDHKENWAKAQ